MKLKKVFITGGAGFIGANVAAHYLKRGIKVTLFDNLSRKGVKTNIQWLEDTYGAKNLTVEIGDVRDYARLKPLIKGHQAIFHYAGQTAVTTSILNPREDFESNALGSFNVLEAVRETNPDAIVAYSSTNKVYGAMSRVTAARRKTRYYPVESPSIDESESISFYSPYGCSKGTGDQYFLDYARIYGLRTLVFRQSCIYGAHQFGVEDQGWVAHFTSQVIKGETIKIYGDGKQVRDMLYITDLVSAFSKAVANIHISQGQVYNLGGGIDNAMSLIELLAFLDDLRGKKSKVTFHKERQGDQKVYISNIDKAKRDFDWRPKIGVHEGVKLLYFWLREHLDK